MYQTRSMFSEEGELELSCLYSNEEGCHMISLEFLDLKMEEYPDLNIVWDNEEFLYNTFYPFLKRWRDRVMDVKDVELLDSEIKQVMFYLQEDLVDDLIELFEYSIEEGWYDYKGQETD